MTIDNKVHKAQRVVTPLDEVELYLNLAKLDHPELIKNKTYAEIAQNLNNVFDLNTNDADVFLLHEPTIEELELDLKLQFQAMGLVY